MKTLFNKYGAYQEEGRAINDELMPTVKAILDKWTALGYSAREIGWLMADTCHCMSSEYTLRNAMKMRKAERENKNHYCYNCELAQNCKWVGTEGIACDKYKPSNAKNIDSFEKCLADKVEKRVNKIEETKVALKNVDKATKDIILTLTNIDYQHHCYLCEFTGANGVGCIKYNPTNDKDINHVKICRETNKVQK